MPQLQDQLTELACVRMSSRRNYRTGQKEKILAFLSENQGRPVTACVLYEHLKGQGSPVSLATIYRNLSQFVERGMLLKY